MNIQVRRAHIEDLDDLSELFDDYRQFYSQASDPPGAREFIASRLGNGDAVILIAQAPIEDVPEGIDAKLSTIGFTQLYPLFSSVRMARIWILNDLYVGGEHRQRGAGRALLEAAAAFGEQDGAAGLQLETQRTNTVAQSLYMRMGWDSPDDTVWFSLALDGAGRARRRDDAPFGVG